MLKGEEGDGSFPHLEFHGFETISSIRLELRLESDGPQFGKFTLTVPSQAIAGGKDVKSLKKMDGMKIVGLLPYLFDIVEGTVRNDVDMQSLFLLTGPNGGGKSSLLRSICAAALLGICGLMVSAQSALIPYFDSIMLHMKSFDSPADKKSSFQVEMSELRSIIGGTTKRSLVLVDEICRGTETAKGTCIAGSIIETLDKIGCLVPMWKLTDGVCKESLAFETAMRERMPEPIIRRAEFVYQSVYAKELFSAENFPNDERFSTYLSVNNLNGTCLDERFLLGANQMDVLREEVESAVTVICQDHIMEQNSKKIPLQLTETKCLLIRPRELPPPSVVGSSSVYVMFRPDKKLYVGETDDLEGRVRAHRSKDGMHDASFLYFLVPGKSLAYQLESLLINQLSSQGFQLTNTADGKHRNFGTSNLIFVRISRYVVSTFVNVEIVHLLAKYKKCQWPILQMMDSLPSDGKNFPFLMRRALLSSACVEVGWSPECRELGVPSWDYAELCRARGYRYYTGSNALENLPIIELLITRFPMEFDHVLHLLVTSMVS
ncbi:hypothetical protein VNO78_21577 [Psophocarpus tetragonolobus]|uniref:DNA mismatch repair proteins mutS family domain-containing protein n=1 Tax=Psophocarpus tetragonolobus TaxID=3891 RepID=A0AAN9SFJ5_PSOTE